MPRAFYHSFDIDRLWIDKNPTTLALTTNHIFLCKFLAIQDNFCLATTVHQMTFTEVLNRRRIKQKPVLRKETSLHWESSGYLLCLEIRRWKDILRPFKKRLTNCLLYWYIYVRLQPLPNSSNTLDARTTLIMNSCGENMKYFTTWIRLQLWIINLVCRKVYRLAKGVRERVVCCKTLKLLYLVVMKGNQSLHKIQGEIVAA